jgi:hypothetical protein
VTTITQPRQSLTAPLVGLALAASVLGGIVGGAVALAAPVVFDAGADQGPQAAETAKWLKYGQEWEARYRQMYPIIETAGR